MADMDASLRSLFLSTVTVKKVTSMTSSGSEVLGAANVLPAYVQVKKENTPGSQGAERKTQHLVVLDNVDVSPIGGIKASDRFWLEDDDNTNVRFSRRPDEIASFKDPVTGAISHYEVTL